MALRTRGALLGLLVAGGAAACATSAGMDGAGTPDAGEDATSQGDVAGGGPSPDAIVLGGDDGVDEGGPDEASAQGDGFVGGKSCAGLPDGTPCGPAPDICHDAAQCTGGACAPPAAKPDGFVCGTTPDVCHDAPVCTKGTCAAAVAKADGTTCGVVPDDCHTAPTCKSGTCGAPPTRPDGYNWKSGDAMARCCGGKAIDTTTDANCGACGIACNTSNGESCQPLGPTWFCRGCVASAACWSHCCSESFTPFSCAASDCAGNCSAQYCPPGTHCVSGGGTSSDYCSY